ncbi:MAG: hypothetical protein KGI52_10370 [Burkholderiales bacterium]|nr:hypothetical protein [Burkholderiales bacterium]
MNTLRYMLAVAALLLTAAVGHAQDHSYPDFSVVPGASRPGATAEEVCAQGFTTKSIRPPASATNVLKRALFAQMQAAGDVPPDVTIGDYELDHCEALTNGGDPGLVRDASGKVDVQASITLGNLRMQPRVTFFEKERERAGSPWYGLDQPYPAAEMKDVIEVKVHKMMCAGQLTMREAQVLSCQAWQYTYGCLVMGVQAACDSMQAAKASADYTEARPTPAPDSAASRADAGSAVPLLGTK